METKKMFTAKKQSLIQTTKKTSEGKVNPFIEFGMKKSSETLSGNGALKYSRSGISDNDLFLEQFASIAMYRNPRSFEQISKDMSQLWSVNKEMAVKFILYTRMITRVTQLSDGSETSISQRGAGLKHEGITRMIWLAVNAPETFAKNIPLFIAAGSWKDVIMMLSYDLQYNGWEGRALDWKFMGNVILAGLENENTSNLVRKYLPQIKVNSRCKTLEAQADNIIAKWICSLVFGSKDDEKGTSYKMYRNLKRSGNAHTWQQLISKGNHNMINFDTVHGRALSLLVSGKYLKNQGLEKKYAEWIASKPVAKFTGFPYELALKLKGYSGQYLIDTINAQFNNLVETAKSGLVGSTIRPISVLDCSGSMSSRMYIGGGQVGPMTSIDVAASSAIFFNEMLEKNSPFYNHYLEFCSKTEMHRFEGNSFSDKFLRSPRNGWGGTNFQSVFDFLVEFKLRNPKVSEDLIPNFIVCFSDGEFNSLSRDKNRVMTNVEAGRQKLRGAFSKEFCDSFGICFVDLPNTFYGRSASDKPKFETFGDCKNTFYFSGYDLSPLGFLFGIKGADGEVKIPKTGIELFLECMNQELLNLVNV